MPPSSGLPKYTVEFYKDEELEVENKRWDATRQQPVPPVTKEKMRRVLKEETRRAAYTEKRRHNYTKATWDALRPQGNPDKDMAYFGLDWHAHERATARDDDYNYASHRPLTDPDTDEPTFLREYAERRQRIRGTGWESERIKPYSALGVVPLAPANVKRKELPGPLRVLGDAWVPEKLIDRGTLVPVQPGVALERESVEKHGKNFYTIDAIEGRRLEVRLRVLKGDPDIYVSNVHDRPDEEHFVWKSMGGGEVEELVIEPDDPRGGPGPYYVTITADKASEYRLEIALVKPAVALPERPRKPFDRGQRQICGALKEAHFRLANVAAGHVTLGALPAQLAALGHETDDVLAASRPAGEALRQYSGLALHSSGVPKSDTRLALSRSLAVLPTGGCGGAQGASASGAAPPSRSQQLVPARSEPQLRQLDAAPTAAPKASASTAGSPAYGRVAFSEAEQAGESSGSGSLGGRPVDFGANLATQLQLIGFGGSEGQRPPPSPWGLNSEMPELQWHPPEGYGWEDLPKESRLQQAMTESVESRLDLTSKLRRQLGAMAGTRALRHVARTQALAHLDPLAHVCRPIDVNRGAEAMLRTYTLQQEMKDAEQAAEAAAAARDAQEEYDALHIDAALEEAVRNQLDAAAASAAKRDPSALFKHHPVITAIDRKYKEKPAPVPIAPRRRPSRKASTRQ